MAVHKPLELACVGAGTCGTLPYGESPPNEGAGFGVGAWEDWGLV